LMLLSFAFFSIISKAIAKTAPARGMFGLEPSTLSFGTWL